jgi:hypothetical protein
MASPGCIPVSRVQSGHAHAGRGLLVATQPGECALNGNVPPQADGRRFSRPPDPYTPPATPEGRINVSDPDSRVVKGLRGFIQGYNAQAVTNEHQIVVAAEVMTAAPDFGHLEPMLNAAQRELEIAGVTERPECCLPMPATGISSRWSASSIAASRC